MALLPTEDNLTNASTTNAQQKTNFANWRNFIADLLGTDSSDKAAARAALGAFPADGSIPLTGDLPLAAGKGVSFEGDTADAFQTLLKAADPTADRVILLPDVSGTLAVEGQPSLLRSYLAGFQMSTPGSSSSLTTGAGTASDSTNAAMIALASPIVKTTAAWALGTATGGLDTGTIRGSALGATCSYATNVMTCTVAPTSGTFQVGQHIQAEGIPAGTTIASLGTGAGGTGTYNLSTSPGTLGARATSGLSWYYNYVIRRPDTGATDTVFSLSPVSPNLPASYTQYRYVGAALTNALAQWTPFIQIGDEFWWAAPVLDLNSVATSTAEALSLLTVPRGRKVKAILNGYLSTTIQANVTYLSDPDTTNQPATITVAPLSTWEAGVASQASIWTNSSAQIRHRENASATGTLLAATLGWVDLRDKHL